LFTDFIYITNPDTLVNLRETLKVLPGLGVFLKGRQDVIRYYKGIE
jgi:hypothetical protein